MFALGTSVGFDELPVTTRLPGSPSSASYTAHKFPGIGDDMIDSCIQRFRAVIPELPDFRRRQIAAGIFEIEKVGPRHD